MPVTASLAFAVAAVLLRAPMAAQSRPVAPKKWTVPRTSYGQPDLQGIWTTRSSTNSRSINPTAFTRPWKGEIPFTKAPGPIYECACHGGNYSMENILKGARAEEKPRKGARSQLRNPEGGFR